jgi:hypothetical protein
VTGLKNYRVRLVETEGGRSRFAFDCEAEDWRHALEQARDAYPHAACVAMKERGAVNSVDGRGRVGSMSGEPVFKVGGWVRTLRDFCLVPAGTIGRICEDDGEVLGIAWRLGGYEPNAATDTLWLIDPTAPRIRDYFRYIGGDFDETIWLEAIKPGEAVRQD